MMPMNAHPTKQRLKEFLEFSDYLLEFHPRVAKAINYNENVQQIIGVNPADFTTTWVNTDFDILEKVVYKIRYPHWNVLKKRYYRMGYYDDEVKQDLKLVRTYMTVMKERIDLLMDLENL